jgi:hypothetical protein
MTIDYRALCAELVDELNQYLDGYLEADLPDENTDETVLLLRRARTALNQPEPVGPTDEELEELAQPFTLIGDDGMTGSIYDEAGYARAVLSRWGRPAIEPIPVSERLPGPEDCAPWPDEPDATPWAWAAKEVAGGWEWAQISMSGIGTETFKRIIAGGGWTHWLPHWALPIPSTNPENQQ